VLRAFATCPVVLVNIVPASLQVTTSIVSAWLVPSFCDGRFYTLSEEEQRDDAYFRLSPEIAINGIN
jgi:hypothetical protein